MKKILTIALAALMMLSLAACGKSTSTSKDSESDMAYIKDKGTLVVGITDFEPMDYQDKDKNWIGFDADMASLLAEKLGVKVKFVVID